MRVEIWSHQRKLAVSVSAASQIHQVRESLYVRVCDEGVEGWGEVSPQPEALNGDPGVGDVIDTLRVFTRRLIDRFRAEGTIPDWTRLATWSDGTAGQRFAIAVLEMALIDHELRKDVLSIDSLWAPRYAPQHQVTVSLMDSKWSDVGDAVRVRVKTSPMSWGSESAERLEELTVPVILDFNASGTTVDEVLSLVQLVGSHCNLQVVEQPFAVGDFATTAELARRAPCAVGLDESIRTKRDVAASANYSAASVLCVKPSRVGGLSTARSLVAAAQEYGLRAYVGGFFESHLGRCANLAVSASVTNEPGDTGPVVVSGPEDEWWVDGLGFGPRPSESFFGNARLVDALNADT